MHRLENGVGVIIDPLNSFMSATVGVWVNVGSRHETAQNNGIAHFLEHLVFKGAGGRDAMQIAHDAEMRGVYLNAATSYERTGFYARCLGEEANFAFDLCSDLVLKPHFEADDFELERNVVIHEINEAFDDSEDLAGVLNQSASFENQAIGRPILGDEKSVKAIKLDDVKAFHQNYLIPENIMIGFGGAIDINQAIDISQKRFGHLKPSTATKSQNAFVTPSYGFESRDIEQLQLVLSMQAPQAGHEKMYASQVLGTILGGGMASRLFQDLREKRGLVYAIDAYLEKYQDVGRLLISAGCQGNKTQEVIERINAHINDLAQNGPNDEELKRAKKTFETSIMLSLESASARLNAAISQAFVLGETLSISDIAKKINAIEASEIKEMAKMALSPQYRAAGSVGSLDSQKPISGFIDNSFS